MQSEKKKLTFCAYIVLIAAAYLTTLSEGANPSVTLTVEGGGSLVGEHCPGTVRILCYGIHLSVIRWRYNVNTDVVTFFSDNVAPSPFTNNPAFLNAKLLSATQDPEDPNFANFSSELVVDVSKLQTESITSIACGDPNTFKMIPVDVEIIQQIEPESPNGTNVTAVYEDGFLTDVSVSWKKLETLCQDFQSSLVYQVALLGSSVVAVNHTSCGEVCIVNFQNFVDPSKEYGVSLFVVNDIGTSEVMEYPTSIVEQSSFYFTPSFLSNDCLFVCECFSNGNLDTNSCSVLYTTDMDPSPIIVVSPLNTRFEITGITSNTAYYFEFSVSVNHTLLVSNRFTERAISSPRLSVLVIVFLTLTILAVIFETVFGIVLCVLKKLNRLPANSLFFGTFVLGILSFIFLIVFSIITSAQEDTCNLDWSRARDALIIVTFLLALFGNGCFLLAFCLKKKSGKMVAARGIRNQLTNGCVTDNTQETIELDKPHYSKEKHDSKDCIPDTQPDLSGQKDTAVESYTGHPEYIEPTKEQFDAREKKQVQQSSLKNKVTSDDKKYTVYKVVVRNEDRFYFLFKRYREFVFFFEKIRKNYPRETSLLKLPPKRYVFSDFDPDFIEERRVGLHDFLINLMQIPKILDWPLVCEFLAVNDMRIALLINNNETIDEPADKGKARYKVELGENEKIKAKITDFNLLKVIRKGTFRKVYLGQHKKDSVLYAIKVLEKIDVKHSMAEKNVFLLNVTHPFLVGLHYSFQTSTKLYFVLDYVNGGKLLFHLQRQRVFDEPRATFYAAEITSALGYLHRLNIIYWDLKLENILLDTAGHIKLTDFGLCKENLNVGDTTAMFCGTPDYLSPEVLNKQVVNFSVDWWCLGMVIYEMMYGLPPFYSGKMYDDILHEPLQLPTHISFSARKLLEGLLQKNKEVRLGSGAGKVEDIKTHPFFRSINWDDLFEKRLEPPFNPPANDALEIQHFDPGFTTESTFDTPSPSEHRTVGVSISVAKNTFTVFSYIPYLRK